MKNYEIPTLPLAYDLETKPVLKQLKPSKYLDLIVENRLLTKMKIGTSNYYINDQLMELFIGVGEK